MIVLYKYIISAAKEVPTNLKNSRIVSVPVGLEPVSYETALKDSWVWKELYKTRNIRPSFNTRFGFWGGMAYTGSIWWLTQGREPWTFQHHNKGGK